MAERKHKHVLEVTRALRFQAEIPIKFWGLCVIAAVYLINRLSSSVLQYKSPYEVLHNKPPSLTHLRVIRCLCYAKIVHESDKLKPRSRRAVHMGYFMTQKGYVLYDIDAKNLFVNRDVVFREDIFPFKSEANHNPTMIFPSSSTSYILDEGVFENQRRISNTPDITSDLSHYCILGTQPTDIPIGEVFVPQSAFEETNISVPSEVRRSTRDRNPPVWLKDFVSLSVNETVLYPISNYSYDHLEPKHQVFIAAFSASTEPHSYHKQFRILGG